ncbi:hypothetical protein NWO25_17620 [Enterococcus lactis]|nr:hypothetical protein [Enterococcus lactis]
MAIDLLLFPTTDRRTARKLPDKKAQLLIRQLDVENLQAAQNKTALEEFVHQSNERITLMDATGKILFDTNNETLNEQRSSRPEIKAVLNGGNLGSALRKSTTLNEDLLYVALPVKKEAS